MGPSDWIKMRCNLDDDPRVLAIADRLEIDDADLIVGKLWRLWRYADQHTVDGRINFATASTVDRLLGLKGLAAALVAVGWLQIDEQGATIPRFEEHNGSSAKRRAMESRRKMSARDADTLRTECGQDADDLRTNCAPRERERVREYTDKKNNARATAAPPGDQPPEPESHRDELPDFASVKGVPSAGYFGQRKPIDSTFAPDKDSEVLAAVLNVDLAAEVAEFVDHALANARTSADPQADFRRWLRKAQVMQRNAEATLRSRASPVNGRRAFRSSSAENSENIRAFLAEGSDEDDRAAG